MIRKVLIANRGEVAVRIMRSCYEMGIRTVAVFSEADRASRHVLYADEAECIGAAPSSQSYLDIDKIIDAAKKHGADAIHPGYGFLSENPQLAERCENEGIVFIGPKAETMRQMGDKISARINMTSAGLPVVPGISTSIDDPQEAVNIADAIGYPVIIKASNGGGGRGIRVVGKKEDMAIMFQQTKSEAMNSFGDDTIFIEKYIQGSHHIEFQILGDNYGNVIHLYDRECSIQRRHQKIVEECPSPFLDDALRTRMGQAAVTAAKAVGYVGAGTIEFIVDGSGQFYFMEMNTRLQVEHPVTEEVCGLDIVKQQILIADGQHLAYCQDDISLRGCAIECRLCAEDTDNNFQPAPGLISQLNEPLGPGIRIDSAAYTGYEIPVYYDSMIGKLVVWAACREYAIERMRRALHEYRIIGLKTNIGYLRRLIDLPEFRCGCYDTSFIPRNQERLTSSVDCSCHNEDIAAIAAYLDFSMNFEENIADVSDSSALNRWRAFGLQKGVLRV